MGPVGQAPCRAVVGLSARGQRNQRCDRPSRVRARIYSSTRSLGHRHVGFTSIVAPKLPGDVMTTKSAMKARAVPNRPTPTFGNPDLPPQGRLNTTGNPESLRGDGPHDEVIEGQFPSQMDPPATDISTQPFFWSSFNISPKRIQNGGWARELTSEDFAISEEIAGVNMHLAPGGIRELHWAPLE
jgi:hypothetical protein